MSTQLNSVNGSNSEASRDWLGALLLRRGSPLLPRFVAYYHALARRPRPWRRQLRRKLAVTLSGAALLLAMAGPIAPAQADPASPEAVIQVVNGEVAINVNGKCSLMEAIWNARSTNAGNMKADCTAGNTGGVDTVSLPNGGDFVLTAAHNEVYGPTGLPVITSAVVIEGHGSTIHRAAESWDDPQFRILAVDSSGDLTLRQTTIRDGGGNDYFSAGGTGITNKGSLTLENSAVVGGSGYVGGAVDNFGTLVMIDSVIADNYAENGPGGLYNGGTATISGSLIFGNDAWYYTGGVLNSGDMVINNSTISGNGSWENGAGGIENYGALTLNNVTVTENSTDYDGPGGIVNREGATLTLNRSIITGNFTWDYYYDVNVQTEIRNYGTITGANFNVFGYGGDDGSFGFTPGATDVVAAGPSESVLGPLADNGGSTWSFTLPLGSPALDLAPSAQCAAAPLDGVDQRGLPRNVNGDGATSNRECDSGATERQFGPNEHTLFVSTTGSGTVGGVAFTPADILRYEPGQGWSLAFDASDMGVTKNLSAFEVHKTGSMWLTFAANQVVSSGTAKPWDVVSFSPVVWSNQTAGYLRIIDLLGANVGLTTSGEKIDALGDAGDFELLLSTAGAAAVPRPGGGVLKAQDEDVLRFSWAPDTRGWSLYFDGTPIPGLKGEDVNGLWVDPATGDLYISIVGAFNLGGVAGNGKDIVKLTRNGSSYTPSLWWDGSAAGFPSNVDGLEILP